MGISNISIDLGYVNFDLLKTDNDFRREAQRILPNAIVKMGESFGEKAWDTLQKSFKGSAIKMNTSSSDKQKFIRESGENYKRTISSKEKKDLEEYIIRLLHERQ